MYAAAYRHPLAETLLELEIPVLRRGRGWLAVDKPSGIPVHPVNKVRENTLIRMLRRQQGDEQLRLVHRLDRETTGVLLGIAGVVIIFFNEIRLADASAAKGSAAIILASFGTAYAGVLIKSRGKHIDPLVLTIGQMAVGVLPLLVLGLWYEGNPLAFNWTARAWIALFYLALVGSALAFVLVYWLMQRMDVTKTQLIPLASTLIAVILGWLVLQEEINWKTLVGGFLILFGLAVSVLGGRRRRKQIILNEYSPNS